MATTYYLTATGNGCSVDGTVPAGAVECTQEQYSNPHAWTISNGAAVAAVVPPPPPPPTVSLATQALAALTTMDSPGGCAIRCFKAGVPFPADWQAYCGELRALVNGTSTATVMPAQPDYPAGT